MPVVGIDIGTTYAYLAISKNREVNVVESIEGRKIFSCVGFNEHERLIGESAVYQMVKNSENTITGVKQLLGKNLTNTSVSSSFKIDQDSDSIKVVANYRGKRRIFYPEQIFSMILTKLKTIGENATGEKISAAVITVPPHFNTAQRVAIKDAANLAGIHVLGLLSETLAAAIDYEGTREQHGIGENVMILHVGGGGFDVTVLSVERGFIRVLSSEGEMGYGGIHLTDLLWAKMKSRFEELYVINIDNDARAKSKLWRACEEAKKGLTLGTSTSIRIDALSKGQEFSCDITRNSFNKLIDESIRYLVLSVITALKQAKINEVHKIFFVGGGTRVPLISEKLFNRFPQLQKALRKTINVDEAPVKGAAVWAEQLTRPVGRPNELRTRLQISDVLPFDLIAEMKDEGNITIASKGSAIPSTCWITGISTSPNPCLIQLWDSGDSPDKNSSSGSGNVNRNGSLIKCSIGIDGIPELSSHFFGKNEPLLRIGFSSEKKKKLMVEVTLIEQEEMNHQKRSHEMHQLERFAYNLQQKYSGKQAQCQDILDWIQRHPDAGLSDIESQRTALDELEKQMSVSSMSLSDEQSGAAAVQRHEVPCTNSISYAGAYHSTTVGRVVSAGVADAVDRETNHYPQSQELLSTGTPFSHGELRANQEHLAGGASSGLNVLHTFTQVQLSEAISATSEPNAAQVGIVGTSNGRPDQAIAAVSQDRANSKKKKDANKPATKKTEIAATRNADQRRTYSTRGGSASSNRKSKK